MDYLPAVEVETSQSINSSVIWLHGLGADGHDFEPIVPELGLPDSAGIRFVFPHAPAIPVTINGGMVMPAWYDIIDMTMDRHIDHDQIMKSSLEINKLIQREIDRGISSNRIVVAGFSQGGAVAYQVALAYPEPLAGLMALSTYLATHETIKPHQANLNLPILICHGTYDMVVPEPLGGKAVEAIEYLGYHPEYLTYPIQHSVSAAEIADISEWLIKVFKL
jgi:phospholipase/carboxylesterase